MEKIFCDILDECSKNGAVCRNTSQTVKLKLVYSVFVCEIPRSFERSSPSDFRTQGSFIHINSRKIFERDLLSSDSVAKSATQKPWVF